MNPITSAYLWGAFGGVLLGTLLACIVFYVRETRSVR